MNILCALGLHRWQPWQRFNAIQDARRCKGCERRDVRSMRHPYPAVAVPEVGWVRSPLAPIDDPQPHHLKI